MSVPDPQRPPSAELSRRPRHSLAWLLPLFAAALALYLGVSAWGGRGVLIRIRAADGYGIRSGDPLRYRGINVGEVRVVELAEDLSEVLMEVRVDGASGALARAGSRFWVVRPRVGLESVEGLETLLGTRHLGCLPGPQGAPVQREFVALADAPLPGAAEEGGLDIVLEAPQRFGLTAGAPISFRQMTIGRVLSVGLSSDATAVEARARIRAPYRELVRTNSRFWEVGGLEFSLGMGGLDVSLESAHALLVGGIALATPTEPGEPVRTGHRFALRAEPDEDWIDWRPALALGSAMLPDGTPRPELLRAGVDWDEGFFSRAHSRSGWLLPCANEVIGPADLLAPETEKAALEVRGERLPLDRPASAVVGGLARRFLRWPEVPTWPVGRVRDLETKDGQAAEDVLVCLEPNASPRALAAARLEPAENGWSIDPAITFDEEWHGAAVLSRTDGKLVGILLVGKGSATIAELQPELFE